MTLLTLLFRQIYSAIYLRRKVIGNGYCLFLTLFLSVNSAVGQQKVAPGTAPTSMKLFFEKVYLHTDRSYYSGGEDLWFSAYLVNGKSTNLTSSSSNLYVELISPKIEVIGRKIIRLDDGIGKGDFQLQDSLPSGWYKLRAYTNWMRNFDDDFLFQKDIYISSVIAEQVRKVDIVQNRMLNFFPEGGSLIEGLGSIVAFKAEDQSGNGLSVVGKIVSSKGDTVASFQSTNAGMGIIATFPKVLKEGMVMHVTSDSGAVKITIDINDLKFDQIATKNISIAVKHAGDEVYSGTIQVVKSRLPVSIPIKKLPAGLAVVTLYDHEGKPFAERLIYIQQANAINLSVTTDKTTYQPREPVVLNIKTTQNGQPIPATFSLAAVEEMVEKDATNIISYLMLESEIKGNIKDAEKYFDLSNPSRLKQLDLLLLTQGWRDYLWKRKRVEGFKIKYLPEADITLTGMVRQKLGSKPLANMNITLLGSKFKTRRMLATTTDSEGRFFFDGLVWDGNQAVKLSSTDHNGQKAGWLLLDSVFKSSDIRNFSPNAELVKSEDLGYNIEIEKRKAYRRSFMSNSDTVMLNAVNITGSRRERINLLETTLTTFGYKDQAFDITQSDYDFKGLKHFLLTKPNGSGEVEGIDSLQIPESIGFYAQGHLVRAIFMVNNKEETAYTGRLDLMDLTMDQVNSVRIKHLINESGGDAFLVYLDVKQSAFERATMAILNREITGYYNAKTFYVPNHGADKSPLRDLRTTVFWSPLIKTNDHGEATVSFFNADPKATIAVNAQGITSNGVPVASKTIYKVQ